MARVLVTGAKGFIGSHMFASIKSDKIGIVRDQHPHRDSGGDIAVGDLRDQGFVNRVLLEYSPDVIVHTAASAIVNTGVLNPAETYSSNVMGTLNLLEAVKKLGRKDVFFQLLSSDKTLSDGESHKEDDPYPWARLGVYEQSKAMQEVLALRYSQFFDVCIVRSSNIYGEGDKNSRIVPNGIRRALAGQNPKAYNEDKRQYIHVSDVVSAFHALQKGRKTGIWHIGTPDILTSAQVCQAIVDAVDPDKLHVEMAQDDIQASHQYLWYIKNQSLNYNKITSEVGWKPLMTFERGISQTVSWWKERCR